ncbi:trypsin [Sergentomyia squamirostris]
MKIFLCTLLFIGSILAKPQFRIVGGQEATPHEFPYMISIQSVTGHGNQTVKRHFCGGSILTENWILTAAHCIDSFSNDTEIVAGAHSISAGNPNEQRRMANRTIKHTGFNGENIKNSADIAVVRVNESFVFNVFVNKINLPNGTRYYPEGVATISGWGSTSKETLKYPDKLQKAQLAILEETECQKLASSNGTNIVCAGDLSGAKSICNGDSGGPLVQSNGNRGLIQLGVVSWGWIPCGEKNKTGVFMNVSFYRSWIQQNIK